MIYTEKTLRKFSKNTKEFNVGYMFLYDYFTKLVDFLFIVPNLFIFESFVIT